MHGMHSWTRVVRLWHKIGAELEQWPCISSMSQVVGSFCMAPLHCSLLELTRRLSKAGAAMSGL